MRMVRQGMTDGERAGLFIFVCLVALSVAAGMYLDSWEVGVMVFSGVTIAYQMWKHT